MFDKISVRDMQIASCLLGWTSVVYNVNDKNDLVDELHRVGGHRGVVISGSYPWNISLMDPAGEDECDDCACEEKPVELTEDDCITDEDFGVDRYYMVVQGPIGLIGDIIYASENEITLLHADDEKDFPDISECLFIEVEPNWSVV